MEHVLTMDILRRAKMDSGKRQEAIPVNTSIFSPIKMIYLLSRFIEQHIHFKEVIKKCCVYDDYQLLYKSCF